ncbi:phage holin family protein [Anaerocolumna xylanovorans]|uniref:Phage holin family Hol44, holin superfamily V n=1 Tax=Anaerocolumna xylanovorans DSM 12503 TaxID=1121345 RepID=A0A1M7Y6E3_9FIRM|nr:phage holin family protein [Anaerocolumna xylanovorans]SHO48161.1 Phage holin family Hol44, holin superfamily V [Anaerocolumna xylanovorans DSM 12503]
MDITFLLQYINVITLGICLCLGYAFKNIKKFDNQYIPAAMLILGTVINVIANIPSINMTVVLSGMISGLASTGLYEAMRNLIEKGQ